MLTPLAVAVSSVAFAASDVSLAEVSNFGRLWDRAVATSKPCSGLEKRTIAAADVAPLWACRHEPVCLGQAASRIGSAFLFALEASGSADVALEVTVVRSDGSLLGKRALSVPAAATVRGLRILAAKACTALGTPDALALDIGLEPETSSDLDLDAAIVAQEVVAAEPPPDVKAPISSAPPPVEPAAPVVVSEVPPAALAEAPVRGTPTLTLTSAAVGAVGFIAGALLGWQTLNAASTRDHTTDRPTWRELQGSAERLGTLTNVAFAVGAAGLLGAGVLYFQE